MTDPISREQELHIDIFHVWSTGGQVTNVLPENDLSFPSLTSLPDTVLVRIFNALSYGTLSKVLYTSLHRKAIRHLYQKDCSQEMREICLCLRNPGLQYLRNYHSLTVRKLKE